MAAETREWMPFGLEPHLLPTLVSELFAAMGAPLGPLAMTKQTEHVGRDDIAQIVETRWLDGARGVVMTETVGESHSMEGSDYFVETRTEGLPAGAVLYCSSRVLPLVEFRVEGTTDGAARLRATWLDTLDAAARRRVLRIRDELVPASWRARGAPAIATTDGRDARRGELAPVDVILGPLPIGDVVTVEIAARAPPGPRATQKVELSDLFPVVTGAPLPERPVAELPLRNGARFDDGPWSAIEAVDHFGGGISIGWRTHGTNWSMLRLRHLAVQHEGGGAVALLAWVRTRDAAAPTRTARHFVIEDMVATLVGRGAIVAAVAARLRAWLGHAGWAEHPAPSTPKVAVRAEWELPNDLYGERAVAAVHAIAFRWLSVLSPETPVPDVCLDTTTETSSDAWGYTVEKRTRLGDGRAWLDVVVTSSDRNDGVTPASTTVVATAHGLPEGIALEVRATFLSAAHLRPCTVAIRAEGPPDRIAFLREAPERT